MCKQCVSLTLELAAEDNRLAAAQRQIRQAERDLARLRKQRDAAAAHCEAQRREPKSGVGNISYARQRGERDGYEKFAEWLK